MTPKFMSRARRSVKVRLFMFAPFIVAFILSALLWSWLLCQ